MDLIVQRSTMAQGSFRIPVPVGDPASRMEGTTQASNVWKPGGTWTLTVHPHHGNGSRIHIDLDRRFKGKGWIFYPAVALFGQRMFKRNLEKTLDALARRGSHSPT
jgi:hypothetical protein